MLKTPSFRQSHGAPWLFRSILCGFLLAQVSGARAREWTFSNGKPPLKAEFVEMTNDIVGLDSGNNTITELPLSAFRLGDKEYIRLVASKAPASAGNNARPNQPKQKGKPEVVATLVPGTVVSRVASGETQISYHVYVPTTFLPDNPPPIIIAFHPGGSGTGILNAMKQSAEKVGWLLVGCDKLRNNMKDDALQDKMEDEVMADIQASLPHDPNRIYLAGFSGGGMRCYGMANRFHLPFAGIIAYGGWMGGAKYQGKRYCQNMAVAAINGREDQAARSSVPLDVKSLRRSHCTPREFVWAGGHGIAPSSITDDAIAWLEQEWKKRP